MAENCLKVPSLCFLKFMRLLMVVAAVLWWGPRPASSQRLLGCPISSLQIVTFNETLLPRTLDNIIPQVRFTTGPLVGTSFINYGPNHTDVWCAPELETFPQPRVNLIFTEPVVIVGIISGGYTYQTNDVLDGLREYVSTFTLQHTLTEAGNQFTPYSANLTGGGEPEFVIDDQTVDQLVVLRKPFSALRVRLQVIERTRSPLFNITCWSMAFFGCIASEAIYEDSEPTSEDTLTTPPPNEDTPTPSTATVTVTTTVFTTPFSTCTPAPATLIPAGQSAGSQQVVSVAIPVALVTIIIVVIVVLVGIGVCIKITRGRSKLLTGRRGISLSSSLATASDTHYANTGAALRGAAQIADSNVDRSRERATTIKAVENELYQLRNDDSVIYEAIPSSTVTHNTIQGNGNTTNTIINTSPISSPAMAAIGAEPPPYSSLDVASPPRLPSSSGAGLRYPHVPSSPQSLTDQESEENYSKVEYTVPFTPAAQESRRRPDNIQLSRNESYGSLPPVAQPHYATPTSALRLIPETQANAQAQHTDTVAMDTTDEYEPMMPIPGTAVLH